MLGDVVLRDTDALGDLADTERLFDQHTDDARPGALAERPQRHDAVIASIETGWSGGRQTVKRERLIRSAGCHDNAITIAQTGNRGKTAANGVRHVNAMMTVLGAPWQQASVC